ncbi:CRE-SPP-15 protein [Caenorhabditis remanei]|uniref:CRE-SPP-15 protein n=1 Tax=Caenorhabditis remanei TaxID=31234 RepID=E3LV11_CAERE|nr:CRE-SPP-15 protein [Caenorhabditis remanei]
MKPINRFILALSFILFVISAVESSKKLHTETSKPLCGLCVNIVKQLDQVLEHGGDIEAAVDKFCKEDVPSFMVDMCEKVIEKNLEYIIEKLKDHEEAGKICTDIFLCRTPKQYYFLETEK